MKHQQVVPDYGAMLQTSGTVLCLVLSGWILFRLVQAVFWLPGYLERTQSELYEQLENKTNITTHLKSNIKAQEEKIKSKGYSFDEDTQTRSSSPKDDEYELDYCGDISNDDDKKHI
ncbi:uncharacterized protein LOC131425334 [Malaya genurostris]|uniref:uncharacterized protein LOC131425334 n=1 Tax=Malaya genurostris TaxID=325434 RepID=UPI0026F39D62|nr:uncharacterized protein LOC131425334 [Malaya genurostris]